MSYVGNQDQVFIDGIDELPAYAGNVTECIAELGSAEKSVYVDASCGFTKELSHSRTFRHCFAFPNQCLDSRYTTRCIMCS